MKELNPNDAEFKKTAPDIPLALKKTLNYAIPMIKAIEKYPEIVKKLDENKVSVVSLEDEKSVFSIEDYLFFQKKGKGKYWGVKKEIALNPSRFMPIASDDPEWSEAFVPISPVRAWKIPYQFTVTVSWGNPVSEPNGGWLVQSINDPNDFWIASEEDFKNYEEMK